MTPETISQTDASHADTSQGDDRTAAVVAMRRVDLAELHASELQAALFPAPSTPDDDVSPERKSAIAASVNAVVKQHRRELDAWMRANGA
ncbi:MAG TPA: hypothetical protein VFY63_16765 [Pseudorhizobium sp.]|nr:hypothetical protein [Pseudorhizobium sp.]